LGHLGESLPYLLGRLDEGYVMAFKSRKPKRLFSEYIKENVLNTTSGKYRLEALVCATSAVGADRILLAADYPWVSLKEAVDLVEKTPISDSDKEKIYHLNAERWLKL
jgi:2,3-dihydroxybenzoate decarboxylase